MSHDKLKAATRARMAQTGERYSVARRAVLTDHDRKFFPISFDTRGADWITKYADTLLGYGPGKSGVWVLPDRLEIRMALFALDVPRASVTRARHSTEKLRGTSGTHTRPPGMLIINGCGDGLVEFDLDPPLKGGRRLSGWLPRPAHRRIILSLQDPDGFLHALTTHS